MRGFLNSVTDHFESTRNTTAASWKMSDAPEDYVATMMRAVVGIEIPLLSLEGKWKVSQNRPLADREGVALGLVKGAGESDRAPDRQMAALVKPI